MTATPHQFECIVDLWLAGREPSAIAGCTGIPDRYVTATVASLRMMGRPRVARVLDKAGSFEAFAATLHRQTRSFAS